MNTIPTIPMGILGKAAESLLANWDGDDMNDLTILAASACGVEPGAISYIEVGELGGHSALWVYLNI